MHLVSKILFKIYSLLSSMVQIESWSDIFIHLHFGKYVIYDRIFDIIICISNVFNKNEWFMGLIFHHI